MALLVNPEILCLRDQLETALEEVRQLRSAMMPPCRPRLRDVSLSPAEQAIVHGLLTIPHELPLERGRRLIALACGRSDGPLSIRFTLCRLRSKLRALDPPIEIKTVYGIGLWLTDENRTRLEARWENRPQ